MLGAIPAALGVVNAGPRMLVSPGALGVGVSFARGSAGLATGADGTTWGSVASGAPRFHGTARRLLIEGARTNLIRNPRAEGATVGVVGSGGAWPTFWSGSGTAVTFEVVGTGTEDGLPYLDLRLTTAGVFSGGIVNFETVGGIALTGSETYMASLHARLVSGSLAGYTTLALRRRTETVTAANGSAVSLLGLTGAGLSSQRFVVTQAAGTDSATGNLRLNLSGNATGSVVLRLAAPGLEIGSSASSPVLPSAGSPAAASRAADVPSLALSGAQALAGTLVLRALLPQTAPAGLDQGLLQLDDGTDANRVLLRNTAGGAGLAALVVSGGATVATLAGGTMTAGTAFRAVLAWNAAGTALCVTGGAVQTTASAPSAAINRLLLGHGSAALNRPLSGEVERLELHAARLPDATLLALANS